MQKGSKKRGRKGSVWSVCSLSGREEQNRASQTLKWMKKKEKKFIAEQEEGKKKNRRRRSTQENKIYESPI